MSNSDENFITIFFTTLYDYIENLFIKHDYTFKSFELVNLNDDHVIYIIVYIITAICLFVLCILTNFYTKRTL
jgi:hypothetical protein